MFNQACGIKGIIILIDIPININKMNGKKLGGKYKHIIHDDVHNSISLMCFDILPDFSQITHSNIITL